MKGTELVRVTGKVANKAGMISPVGIPNLNTLEELLQLCGQPNLVDGRFSSAGGLNWDPPPVEGERLGLAEAQLTKPLTIAKVRLTMIEITAN